MITFHSEGIPFNLQEKTRIRTWITQTIVKNKRKAGDIAFIFCSDQFLLDMNRQYLDHDTYTDIITFDYSGEDRKQPVSGEIYISIDRVEENAKKFNKFFEDELHRVIIHGILHLLGFSDKNKKAKEEMRKQEDLCLKSFDKI